VKDDKHKFNCSNVFILRTFILRIRENYCSQLYSKVLAAFAPSAMDGLVVKANTLIHQYIAICEEQFYC